MGTFQNEQAADDSVSKLTKSMESLEATLTSVDKAQQTSSSDTSASIASLEGKILSLQKQLESELKAHGQKVDDALLKKSDSSDDAKSKSIEALESKLSAIEKKVDRMEKKHKEMKISIKAVDKLIAEQNNKIKAVRESTIGAIASRFYTNALDTVSNLGEIATTKMQDLVKRVQEIDWKKHGETAKEKATEFGNSVMAKVQEVDWKGHYENAVAVIQQYTEWILQKVQSIDWEGHYKTLTDPRTYQSLVDGIQSAWAYVDNWWMNGVQPTLARQIGELSVNAQVMMQDAMDFVHSHMLYKEMLTQLTPYMEMANVPTEYSSYVVDGLLVIFVISGLSTLTMILGLFCDCLCPLKTHKVVDSPSKSKVSPKGKTNAKSAGNGIHSKGKKGSKRGRSGTH